jgi:hypothetical protein
MAAEKTKIKTYRLKTATLDAINELCLKSNRKHNWYVQKILDSYLQKLKNQ